jgi:Na+-transporting NADH:ubiquinone oxidoreductase subunit E/electron transport complex protein RnfA
MLINDFSELILIALTASFLANAVLCRAMGFDRIKNMEEDGDEGLFFTLQALCSIAASCVFWLVRDYTEVPASFLERFGISRYYSKVFLWPLFIAVVTAAVFIIVFVIAVKIAPYDKVTSAARQLPFAAFNTFVLGIILLQTSAQYGFWETVVFTVASNIGYMISYWMLREGDRLLQNRDVPEAFRGLPVRLLYLSALAVAFYALTGHSLSSLL